MSVDYAALNELQPEAEEDPFTVQRYRQFVRHLNVESRKILDVGCATGRGGQALKTARPDCLIYGLDCVKERLDRLPLAYSGSVCGFSTSIPVEKQAYDAILAGEFIEHLTYADTIATIREFRRITRAGGQLLLTTPYPDYIRLLLTGGSTIGGAHLSAHYPKQVRAMLEEMGYADVKCFGSGRMSRLIGERFPIMTAYGSFLIVARAR